MGSNSYRMDYGVDLVFCIDATMSMDHILDTVKNNALNFYQDFRDEMDRKHKRVGDLRIRIVAFRDYYYDREKAMMVTDFFHLPEQALDNGREPFGKAVLENKPKVLGHIDLRGIP